MNNVKNEVLDGSLYLDLMKRVLVNDIYDDHEYLIQNPKSFRKLGVGEFIGLPRKINPVDRELGRVWPPTIMSHTMIGRKRLDNLQTCIHSVIENNIPGDLIETGVWRGGATIFMKACLRVFGADSRKVWVADSFEGLPPPQEEHPEDKGDVHHTYSSLAVSDEQVRKNFQKYGLLDENIIFLKGWFSETLSRANIGQLAIVRLDGDMYGSTMDALNALYPKLSIGGYLIVDDYCLKPCAKAIHDFRDANGVTDTIIDIDDSGIYWRKS